ncbi:MAG: hypothetical protein ACQEQN_09340 [Thermodesulfobacteriota bacterium]
MTQPDNTVAPDGLKFFGQMSASISHELKNALSIMNESAGLLGDLSAVAEQGGAIEPAKVKRLSGMVQQQIKRADDIIRNMNRFSHLVDEPFRQIETSDFLRLVAQICRRLAASAGARLAAEEAGKPLNIVTRPFYLHYLLWELIQFSINTAGATGDLTLMAEPAPDGGGVHIVFSGLETLPDNPEQHLNGHTGKALMSLLGAKLHGNAPEKILILFLPETMDQ